MSDESANGRATIREVVKMLQELDSKIDHKFAVLDEKYVLRAACRERHKYVDPRQIWAATAALAILGPLLTALIIGAI